MAETDDDLARFTQLIDGGTADTAADSAAPAHRRRIGWIAAPIAVVVLLVAAGGYAAYALNTPVSLPAPAVTRDLRPQASEPVALTLPADAAAMVSVHSGERFLGPDGLTAASGETGPLPMASISKLITALVVLDAVPLDGPDDPGPTLTFDRADHALYDKYYVLEATVAPMPIDSTMSLRGALELMLVASACNYAEAVTGWAFGSQAAFLSAAGDWLDRHGFTQTALVEPTGIDERNVSTAAELIAIGELAMANGTIADIVGMASVTGPGFRAENTNTLLGSSGIRGIKTGTLDVSNLLYSALLDVGIGEPLVVTGVELGARSRSELNADVERLLASIRSGFRDVQVGRQGEVFGSYATPWGAEARMVLEGDATVLTWSDTPITATMETVALTTGRSGERVGSVTWTAGSQTATAPLVLDRDIEPPDAWWRLTHPFELG